MQSSEDRLMSTQELADYLGVPITSVYAWRRKGIGPVGFRIGKYVKFRRNLVDEWVLQQADDRKASA